MIHYEIDGINISTVYKTGPLSQGLRSGTRDDSRPQSINHQAILVGSFKYKRSNWKNDMMRLR